MERSTRYCCQQDGLLLLLHSPRAWPGRCTGLLLLLFAQVGSWASGGSGMGWVKSSLGTIWNRRLGVFVVGLTAKKAKQVLYHDFFSRILLSLFSFLRGCASVHIKSHWTELDHIFQFLLRDSEFRWWLDEEYRGNTGVTCVPDGWSPGWLTTWNQCMSKIRT